MVLVFKIEVNSQKSINDSYEISMYDNVMMSWFIIVTDDLYRYHIVIIFVLGISFSSYKPIRPNLFITSCQSRWP